MYEGYQDKPKEYEKFIESLTNYEESIFNKGYALALNVVLQQITEAKIDLQNRIMHYDNYDHPEAVAFRTSDKLLEVLERQFTRQVKHLEEML